MQENSLSAFSQWRAAASSPDLPAFLADTALVRTALLSISKAQATAAQLAKTIADKAEAGYIPFSLPCMLCWDMSNARLHSSKMALISLPIHTVPSSNAGCGLLLV